MSPTATQQETTSSTNDGRDNVTPMFKEKTDKQYYYDEFVNYFGGHIAKEAASGNWNAETRQLACLYIKQLTKQASTSVSVPEGLKNEVVIKAIQKHFREACLAKRTRPGTFAGQSNEWFARPSKQSARKQRVRHQKPKRTTPSVMPRQKTHSQAS
jgi:hypothetical protein